MSVRHAAAALQTARLIDRQRQEFAALKHIVRTLEEQSHEHANRLHTLDGLIAIGEYDHARRLVASLQSTRELVQRRIAERVHEPTLRGLLVARTAVAEQRGLKLRITDRSRLERIPPTVDEASAVTILGNLLDNALDAVAGLPRGRRRVVVSFTSSRTTTTWRVRDYGSGIPDGGTEVFARGVTRKANHSGLGLHLVAEAVNRAHGTIAIRHLNPGASFTVRLPLHSEAVGGVHQGVADGDHVDQPHQPAREPVYDASSGIDGDLKTAGTVPCRPRGSRLRRSDSRAAAQPQQHEHPHETSGRDWCRGSSDSVAPSAGSRRL
ncbi:MAG: sensor histidine kinase [Solirubrobacteraceae bacterium]